MSFPAVESEASIEKLYAIGERLLAFQFNDEVAARVAGDFIEGMHFTPLPSCAARFVHCTVKIFYGEAPTLPSGCQVFEVPRGLCYTNGDVHFLDIDESRIAVYAPAARTVSVWLGTTEHARHPVAVVNTLSYAVQAALRRGGLYLLHAAGVVEPETNAGLIVVGNSNSGKSSLTIRLAAAGWRYLSDDMLVLDEADGVVVAWALRRVFSVSSESLAGSGLTDVDAALGAPVNSDPSKRRLEPRQVFPDSFVESCRPRVLLFPTLTGEQASRVEKLSAGEAMTQLIRQCPWASYDRGTAREHLRLLALAAKQSTSYKLFAGLDLLETATRAPELLASCLGH
ncbi:MAG TPA: hypothetical protein VF656_12105 [Pyrinomonadaceae bacterium]|jgi:hypothetical protein